MKTPQEITREKAEIMLAFANGADIEFAYPNQDDWAPMSAPAWDWHRCEYRIKPKPKVPRRASVQYDDKDITGDPWQMAWPINESFSVSENRERVEMIELTPEVAAAIIAAGITFEDADKWKEGQQ